MNIRLSKALGSYVERRVAAGDYRSREDLVREALELLKRRDAAIRELRAMVADGVDDLKRGRLQLGDDAFFQALKTEGKARVARRAQRKSA